jgi:hypothetical protein
MKNITGLEFDKNNFQQVYDTNPMLQNIVSNFDDTGVQLNTDNQPMQGTETPSTGGENTGIDASAKRAANNIIKNM